MAVLLHVQGSGRDPLRPFGGHAIRTVAWERFDPGSVGRDVDTIVISPPDPLTGVDAVAAIRDAGSSHPVLLVPDESPGWRQVAASRLPNADVVLGGIRSLPDYLPSADYPLESGQWPDLEGSEDTREAARVIDLRLRIPRGGTHRMLRERIGDQPHDIASAVRQFTADLTGDHRTEASGAVTEFRSGRAGGGTGGGGTTGGSTTGSGTTDGGTTDGGTTLSGGHAPIGAPPADEPFEWPVPEVRQRSTPTSTPTSTPDPWPVVTSAPSVLRPPGEQPDTPEAATHPGAPLVSRSLLHTSADTSHGRDPLDVAGVAERSVRRPVVTTGQVIQLPGVPEDAPPPRRTARGLNDPAVLVPQLLGCVDRVDSLANVASAMAELVRTTMPADAVDVMLRDAGTWHTARTMGSAAGAGGVADVVDIGGLVTWLESFDTPVVLDGSDLAAPGSWVLAGLVRGQEASTAVILCWREPGQPVFDPVSLTLLADIAGDARPSLDLAMQVRQLARALSAFVD